ncbi:Abi family protein [Collinsella ihumii]|uniref:Abi family protein n=1 Tax=Collinsella ihumii TaxID=1720204 RepID=A0AAW7K3U1_9ACTN|nr:Abi family protein [Collinsella ihumii]MDN0069561.1 Abi family protein [Collinsella ihumii]
MVVQNEDESRKRKPWLTAQGQVEHLKSKGVRFNLISEEEAGCYLENNSNYFRLRAYRTGFSKVEEGSRKGEYANLDFKMLIDLSIIDMLLRYQMLPLALDIEHFAKVKLLGAIEAHDEDGYEIVSDFIGSCDSVRFDGSIGNRVKDEISKGRTSPYLASLISRYPQFDYPAWSFIEVITFGTFVYFYRFCARRFLDKRLMDDHYLLQSVKTLRNACAHNNCILNNLVAGEPMYRAQHEVTRALGTVPGVSAGMRRSKMRNDRMQQIATTLYTHRKFASVGVKRHRAQSLSEFVKRMNRNMGYYDGNCQVVSSFDFLTKVIGAWYPVQA